MAKIGFVGFGEVNTPVDVIVRKCSAAEKALNDEGLDIVSVYPIADDYEEKAVNAAVKKLKGESFDALVVCVAGWIPTHAVVKVTEHFRHLPMVLWGLCGWYEGDRLVTTADQAGTSGLRAAFEGLGYTFKYVYDVIGKKTKSSIVADYCNAAIAKKQLLTDKVGMAGYRDMNLYGTLYDGISLKKTTGIEIESFEMLEIQQRYDILTDDEKRDIVKNRILKWKFLKPANDDAMMKAAGYYLAVKAIADERGYKAISLKDVDGMKKLCGFPPAPIFMLLSEDGCTTVPENDSLGAVTQLMMNRLTGQLAGYLEFYEFFENSVLAGVPDFIAADMVDGDTYTVLPAAFGMLSQGILNVSKVKTGTVTMSRLVYLGGKYTMQVILGKGKNPPKWEECGWDAPAPQLSALEIEIGDVEVFADNVACQHYIITYGDNRAKIKDLCKMLGIEYFEVVKN
jgi:L-fucose isomerase-like protein